MSARVVVAIAYGGPEVLELTEDDPGAPGPGEVLLAVRAAGINPIDWKLYSGMMGDDPGNLPLRLGFEAAGVVEAVGDGAQGPAGPLAVGDEVIAFQISGAYAERLVVDAGACVPKPQPMSWEQAGGLMLTGATAIHTLTATGVGDGDTVLLHGAAGGVGLMVVQIAVARGARVIGTASESRHEAVRAAGGEPVVYGDGLLDRVRALAPEGVDVAIDAVGSDEAVDTSLALVADRDRIASIAAFARAPQEGFKLLGGAGPDAGDDIRAAARLELTELVTRGALTVTATGFPLDQVAEAHRVGIAGRAEGKLVLVP